MKAKQFIIERLEQISQKFVEIQIRYEFRASTQSHIVEVKPLSLFEDNEAYMQEELNLEAAFEDLFPAENIVFISEDSLTEIKNAELRIGYDTFVFDNEISFSEFTFTALDKTVHNEPVMAGENNYAIAA